MTHNAENTDAALETPFQLTPLYPLDDVFSSPQKCSKRRITCAFHRIPAARNGARARTMRRTKKSLPIVAPPHSPHTAPHAFYSTSRVSSICARTHRTRRTKYSPYAPASTSPSLALVTADALAVSRSSSARAPRSLKSDQVRCVSCGAKQRVRRTARTTLCNRPTFSAPLPRSTRARPAPPHSVRWALAPQIR